MSGAPMVVKAKISNIKITFHGENHININNSYYESLKLPASAIILVEHSTNACEIKPEHEEAFLRHAKGSEWVFYTHKKANNPNVICFDTRSEHGYLNAYEEQSLRQLAGNFYNAPAEQVRDLLMIVIRYLTLFQRHEGYFISIPGYYERSFSLLKGQLKALVSLVKYSKTHPDSRTVLQIPIEDLMNGLASTIVDNMVKIASVSADISLRGALEICASRSPAPSEIHVFCGKNHALRMTRMAPLKGVKVTGYMEPTLEESSNIELVGDPELDRRLARLL